MITKKTILKSILFLGIFLVAGLASVNFASAQSCPSNTIAAENQATLVGEIIDDGGDPNLQVWFEYGQNTSYGSETSHISKSNSGLFCTIINNLQPCTVYRYLAVAQNSAGTSYGESKTFTTTCSAVSVDIKANNLNGPITVSYNSSVNISWTSSNAVSCQASGEWSGSKSTSGSQSIPLNNVRSYTFTVNCQGSGGQTSSDSVTVNVTANPPVVITKPAVITY